MPTDQGGPIIEPPVEFFDTLQEFQEISVGHEEGGPTNSTRLEEGEHEDSRECPEEDC